MMKEFSVDQLRICTYENNFELGKSAADFAEIQINSAIKTKGQAVIILATGASQFEFLDEITQRNLDWSKIVAFHLDEYVGISENHPASFRRYLKERIFNKTAIKEYYLIDGDCEDVEQEIKRLEKIFNQFHVDIAFVGIGENGHLAFNDPPAKFEEEACFKIVNLDKASRIQQMGEGWFDTIEEVPSQAITMTIPAIMSSSVIACIVPDGRKAAAVKNTITEAVSPLRPASVLRRHPQAVLFLDKESISLTSEIMTDINNKLVI